ncbi:GDSL-type esterase/lipase family protein [Glaciibacter psychrotolerans]|uniref:Lysophospholipase L1-like esterase n=1 Tax=Glaciibacter psychrotolerans TaxID=670054 RepID=A0A7Z0EE59_9MICO|nr:GDSL-type esterase/lipase family protein [Leifsonia psychrotolerans]NYJ20007.1 lysophospholipase L1-like esterase [Leifsonia psychrotolerans]
MSESIVFIGDGLVAGGRWEEWLPDYDVINLGVGGETTDGVLARLDNVVELQPSAVVLAIGTNDLGWRRSDEYVVRNIETILVTLRKQLPTVRILIHSVFPREREFVLPIQSINRHLWQFAPTTRARYLDLWPVLAEPDGELKSVFTTDRLHLNAQGYAAWLAELKFGLEELFEYPPSSSVIPVQNA